MMYRRLWITSVILTAWSVLGCDDRPPAGPVPVHPVTGTVTFKGKPVPDATVSFIPVNKPAPAPAKPGEQPFSMTPNAVGKTNAQGKFGLHTYVGNDGAPAGDYLVSVAQSGGGDTRDLLSPDKSAVLNIRLPAKYADAKLSGLKATVKEGENMIPEFDLK